MSIFDISMELPRLARKGIVEDSEQTSGTAGSHFLHTQERSAEGRLDHLPARGTAQPFRSFETMRSHRGES